MLTLNNLVQLEQKLFVKITVHSFKNITLTHFQLLMF